MEYCFQHDCVNTRLPKEENNILKFINYERMHYIPFAMYADFECCLKPMDNQIGNGTKQFQKHELSGYCYLPKCFDDSLYKPKLASYTKKLPDESVVNNAREIYQKFKFPKKIIFGEKEKEDFEKSKNCYACGEKFEKDYRVKYNKNDDKVEIETVNNKVADHCHYTGKYHGDACIKCNSKMRKPKFIPVIFHNLQKYDSHLFIKALGTIEGKLSCIPYNEENYISFIKEIIVDQFEKEMIVTEAKLLKIPEEDIIECEEFIDAVRHQKQMVKIVEQDIKMITVKRQLRFIDSFKFMSTGLGKLVENFEKNLQRITRTTY